MKSIKRIPHALWYRLKDVYGRLQRTESRCAVRFSGRRKKSDDMLLAASAWLILLVQSAGMIHTDLYAMQPVLFCVVVALFFKPVLYATRKMDGIVLRRHG